MTKLAHIGLVFGTDTGNTEEVGGKIAKALRAYGYTVDMMNVTEVTSVTLQQYKFLIMGIPTWDFGGIQEDWEDFEADLQLADLSEAVVALYGLGDQRGYGDYFVDAMGWLYERVLATGAEVVGHWPVHSYNVAASLAFNENKTEFCGLAIDEDQQFELTNSRVQAWVKQIVAEYQRCALAS
jgi:flavodoxin I/flavodoxin II